MTPANRMPAVGCHAKQKQRMMEIKGTARIRGGEGERGEPHVWKRRWLQNVQLVKSQLLQENSFPPRPRWNTLILCLLHKKNYLLSLELSHPAVPVASELIRQPARPPTRSGTMNILSGLWSNTRRGREAFGGCREGGKTRVGLNILFNYMWIQDTKGWEGFGVGELTNKAS